METHEVFVVCYQIDGSDEINPIFRFGMSSIYLIEIEKDTIIVHAYSTYKISRHGFPALEFDTTESSTLLCLSVSSNEQKEDFK